MPTAKGDPGRLTEAAFTLTGGRCMLGKNPEHLEPVTHLENAIRGMAPMVVLHREGVCRNGHPANQHAYRAKRKDGSIRVAYCRACRREKRAAARLGGGFPASSR